MNRLFGRFRYYRFLVGGTWYLNGYEYSDAFTECWYYKWERFKTDDTIKTVEYA
jgi:hypothetical protein